MSISQLREIKKRVIPVFKARGITRAGIFGSASRGELKQGSDIDLLIDTKGKLSLFDLVGIKQELQNLLSRRVDLVEYQAIKPSIRKKILKDHISLL